MPNDPSTPVGYVRLLITDVQRDGVAPEDLIFADGEIEAFLARNGDNVYRAAAVALETIATDQVLVLKVIKTLDVETDGAKVAAQLLARAKTLREQADDDVDDPDDQFAIGTFADPVFGWRDHMLKQFIAEG